jgi:acyl-ACP thioesterase
LRFFDLPRFRDEVDLSTFCSGTGRRWAERRTTVRVGSRIALEAVAIWVYVDEAGKPAALEEWFWDLYRTAANGRTVSGRLHHDPPPAGASAEPWPLRRADFDVLAHVNNAVAWAAVEDALAAHASGRRLVSAEVEYRAPIDEGDVVRLLTSVEGAELACWLVVGDVMKTSARVVLA